MPQSHKLDESLVIGFEGNDQDYKAERKKRLGAAADQLHRIKYKKFKC